MANQQAWGVTQVIVRYVSGADTWEVSLDPENIDALVFNWERFKKINEVIGDPLPEGNHVLPDGRLVQGDDPPDVVAQRIGLSGPPQKIGPREEGTSGEPACLHNVDCTWWCIGETHNHDDI
jgi:hypothetical protein